MKTPLQDTDEFEKRLSGVPLRPPPAEWRQQILAAASTACPRPVAHDPRLSTFDLLRSLLWPHPVAWGSLAVAWVCIGLLHWLGPGEAPGQAAPQVLARNWSEQRREVAMMLSVDAPETPALPKPRSDRSETNRNV